MHMRSSVGRLLATGLAALVIGAAGCAAGADSGYHVIVRQGDRVLDDFDLTRLAGLPQIEITTPGSHGNPVQRGPAVRSVLDAAGANDVRSVRVEGSDPAQTLTAAELDRVVLSFTKRDTVKLAGADLDRDRWVRDVSVMFINP